MTTAYLNGKFLPLDQANISAMDRGFLFGDGVYEVLPAYHGQPFRVKEHLQRLRRSLQAICLDYGVDDAEWQHIFTTLIAANGNGNQSIYLQITRGPALVREHIFPANPRPTVFAYSQPLITPPLETLSQGIHAITVPDLRWQRCDIKAITLLANVLARQQAITVGATEAILINQGLAIEGAATNLFIVYDGTLTTPPISAHILGGITRELIIELAEQQGITVEEKMLTISQLFAADEIWLTNSTKEIMPVIKLDDITIGNGKAGPLWWTLIRAYQAYKNSLK